MSETVDREAGGSSVWERAFGDENASRGPGMGSQGQGGSRKCLCLRSGLLLLLISQCGHCEVPVASYDFQREARILDFCVQSCNFKMLGQLEEECRD